MRLRKVLMGLAALIAVAFGLWLLGREGGPFAPGADERPPGEIKPPVNENRD